MDLKGIMLSETKADLKKPHAAQIHFSNILEVTKP